MNDGDSTLEHLIEIAARAAHVVNEVYARDFRVDYKGPRDPVTEADRRANRLICQLLHERFPGVPVVAEESDEASFAGFRSEERVFFVDPVDGTREFVARNDEFVIMIGLLHGDRATQGVIHAPAQATAWAGHVGRGAFEITADGSRRPVTVSTVSELERARVVASRSHRSADLERAVNALGAGALMTLGSAGLKSVAIARDLADVYIAPNRAGKRWDACAPDAIVRAAGGAFTDTFGEPIDYRAPSLVNDRGVLATNGHVHEQVLARLKELRLLK